MQWLYDLVHRENDCMGATCASEWRGLIVLVIVLILARLTWRWLKSM